MSTLIFHIEDHLYHLRDRFVTLLMLKESVYTHTFIGLTSFTHSNAMIIVINSTEKTKSPSVNLSACYTSISGTQMLLLFLLFLVVWMHLKTF